ncbi:MAG: DUF664 domain-containing protein [Saprospiraceae bacterium]|nr:DUF664 domain-containing protein [Pyrinomonadaceae bacterium]
MEIPRDVLEPVQGLSREAGLLLAGLEEVRTQTIELIEDLSEEELATTLLPNFHQIGSLALHLAENEFWWIQAVIAGKEISDEDRKLAHLDEHTLETDFRLRGYDAKSCIGILNMIHERSIETLSEFSDDRLDTLILCEPGDPRFECSPRWVLHHLIDHEAHHKGQIAMIKRLIRKTTS